MPSFWYNKKQGPLDCLWSISESIESEVEPDLVKVGGFRGGGMTKNGGRTFGHMRGKTLPAGLVYKKGIFFSLRCAAAWG